MADSYAPSHGRTLRLAPAVTRTLWLQVRPSGEDVTEHETIVPLAVTPTMHSRGCQIDSDSSCYDDDTDSCVVGRRH
eukprot:3105653-Rhodomonas_salina.3